MLRSIYSEKYYWCNSHSLKNLCRQEVSTKFQWFKIVYLCTMGSRLKMLILFLMVYPSMSLFCFIIKKIAMCSCWLGCCPVKIPHRILRGSAAWIRGSSSWYNRFLLGIASRNLCNLWSHLRCEMCWMSWKNGKMAVGSRALNNVMCTSYYHHNPV